VHHQLVVDEVEGIRLGAGGDQRLHITLGHGRLQEHSGQREKMSFDNSMSQYQYFSGRSTPVLLHCTGSHHVVDGLPFIGGVGNAEAEVEIVARKKRASTEGI
jgi:hypothetical protein